VFDKLAEEYASSTMAFKMTVIKCPDGNFLLIPAGNNQVGCIHHCFIFGEFGKPAVVVGIFGSR
jgi:hypothetical protein